MALVKIGLGLSIVKSLKLRIIYINKSLCPKGCRDRCWIVWHFVYTMEPTLVDVNNLLKSGFDRYN